MIETLRQTSNQSELFTHYRGNTLGKDTLTARNPQLAFVGRLWLYTMYSQKEIDRIKAEAKYSVPFSLGVDFYREVPRIPQTN